MPGCESSTYSGFICGKVQNQKIGMFAVNFVNWPHTPDYGGILCQWPCEDGMAPDCTKAISIWPNMHFFYAFPERGGIVTIY